jgi:hypothetical protein
MKKLLIVSILTLLSTAVFSQADVKQKQSKTKKTEILAEDTLPKVPELKFTKLVHDYGTIYKNDDGNCYFEFKNSGKAGLILTNVSSSCGCTIPQWPKDSIAPGQTSQIKVSYNTSRVGVINKNVYVDWNGGERVTLTIKGNVIEKPQEIVPENKTSPILNNE